MHLIDRIDRLRGDRQDMIPFVTSNDAIGGTKPGDNYGERALSRMHSMFNYIEIAGIDRRRK